MIFERVKLFSWFKFTYKFSMRNRGETDGGNHSVTSDVYSGMIVVAETQNKRHKTRHITWEYGVGQKREPRDDDDDDDDFQSL